MRMMPLELWLGENYRRYGLHRIRRGLNEYLYSMNYGRSESGMGIRGRSNAQSSAQLASYYIA
jgi:hypothetical protein